MEIPSLARSPVAPVRFNRSDPARSTKWNLAESVSNSMGASPLGTRPSLSVGSDSRKPCGSSRGHHGIAAGSLTGHKGQSGVTGLPHGVDGAHGAVIEVNNGTSHRADEIVLRSLSRQHIVQRRGLHYRDQQPGQRTAARSPKGQEVSENTSLEWEDEWCDFGQRWPPTPAGSQKRWVIAPASNGGDKL